MVRCDFVKIRLTVERSEVYLCRATVKRILTKIRLIVDLITLSSLANDF